MHFNGQSPPLIFRSRRTRRAHYTGWAVTFFRFPTCRPHETTRKTPCRLLFFPPRNPRPQQLYERARTAIIHGGFASCPSARYVRVRKTFKTRPHSYGRSLGKYHHNVTLHYRMYGVYLCKTTASGGTRTRHVSRRRLARRASTSPPQSRRRTPC